MPNIISIVLMTLGIIFIGVGIYLYTAAQNIKLEKVKEQQKINDKILELSRQVEQLNKDIEHNSFVNEELSDKRQNLTKEIVEIENNIQTLYNNKKEIINNQLEEYKKNKEYEKNEYLDNIKKEYAAAEIEKQKQLKELEKIRNTVQATIEAQRRATEIKENKDFYCLSISDTDKSDIAKLEQIKKTLNKPRVLSMLIWQTWYQKPLKTLAAKVLGVKTVTGIYKITNIITDECYIGQAVDIATRWNEHAKCGLGIDTPANNKLYKAMQEYGLWNFSWEKLEECSREQLNEKEKYYINLYMSNELGYNSTKGNK